MNGEIDQNNGRNCRFKLFACEILFREICSIVAVAKNRIDIEFLPKGLHDIGRQAMSSRLSEKINSVDETEYNAILLGYALCSGGIVGLTARTIPIVVPRAHDCITLFLGNRQRYHDYFFANSGTFFKTTGWIERGASLGQGVPDDMSEKLGLGMSFQKMVERYGEDNARYLKDQLSQMRFYTKMAFIETGVEPDDFFEQQTIELAQKHQWKFEKLQGDLNLLYRLLNGIWDNEDFLIVPPGYQIDFSYDDNIIRLKEL
ncbi:MAG: DUF1638 domain-containing protein [Planctomycetaceae bacterium]|jgi:hypothetical protein|nr:DUF1638 domain-containing protein [Planctomycetaceae bacterium]